MSFRWPTARSAPQTMPLYAAKKPAKQIGICTAKRPTCSSRLPGAALAASVDPNHSTQIKPTLQPRTNPSAMRADSGSSWGVRDMRSRCTDGSCREVHVPDVA
eukprot:5868933-Prymnesium_polylepis.1